MIDFKMMTQPDDESCGISCLYSIYKYHGIDVSYEHLVQEVDRSLSGGTLAPLLGKNALLHGCNVTLYTNNLILFDPTWFNHPNDSNDFLAQKLIEQLKRKNPRLLGATHLFLEYLSLGGKVSFRIINVDLLEGYFARSIPVMAALNSTYLYDTSREDFDELGNAISDDIMGKPCGHFVVLYGHERNEKLITVADPFVKNPLSRQNYYKVSPDRLINAIMLGLSTYDGNLLIIEPKISAIR